MNAGLSRINEEKTVGNVIISNDEDLKEINLKS